MTANRAALLLACTMLAFAATIPQTESDGRLWWKHVTYLADDQLEGRATGTEGYRKAAAYVASEFKDLGLQPAGTDGYFQPVEFQTRMVKETESQLSIERGGQTIPLQLGRQAIINVRSEPAPELRAGMVFAGYGLKVPEMKHNDLRGLNVRGKIVVFITGAPRGWPASLSAHVQSGEARWEVLRKAGAVGIASIARVQTTPWTRVAASRLQPSMTAADPGVGGELGLKLSLILNPEHAGLFFAGSGHTVQELFALAAANKPLPRFLLRGELHSRISLQRGEAVSPNVIAKLEGADAKLKHEFVIVSAHLDHLGKTASFTGDTVYNGAMDNASGVAAVLEVARQIQTGPPPKRSILFATMTGEEKGLQGSRYFARHPTVPAKKIAGDLNMDMFMPLHGLNSLVILGGGESTLGANAEAVAKSFNLPIIPDPMPEQRRFIRSDQYSFIREGIPALAFKFGYEAGSAEEKLQKAWLRERYHALSDDLTQPVNIPAAGRFTEYLTELARYTANDPHRPAWNQGSFFRRFKK